MIELNERLKMRNVDFISISEQYRKWHKLEHTSGKNLKSTFNE